MAVRYRYNQYVDYSHSRYNEWARYAPKNEFNFKSIYAADADMYHYGKKSIKCLIESKMVGEPINLSAQTKLPAIANAAGLPAFTLRCHRASQLRQWKFDLSGDNERACTLISKFFRLQWDGKHIMQVPLLNGLQLCEFLDNLPETKVFGPAIWGRCSYENYLKREIVI